MTYLMTSGSVAVGAWARMHDSTSITWATSQGEAEFTLGGLSGFDLLVTTEALCRLVDEGTKALTELDAETLPA